jgi:D-threo-aldose 1-dehydrogenase
MRYDGNFNEIRSNDLRILVPQLPASMASACFVRLIMGLLYDRHVSLGSTGVHTPPIVFCAAAFGNVKRVITEQAKIAICSEWFRQVKPPVVCHVSYRFGDGIALEVLGRILRRFEVPGYEIIIELSVDGEASNVKESWEKSCWLLGTEYRPRLILVENPDAATWRSAMVLKAANAVQGVGIAVRDRQAGARRLAEIDPDWVTLVGGCTAMRHSSECFAFMAELASRQIPIVLAGVFDGGFLVGGNRLDGVTLSADDAAHRSYIVWRKAFVALCDGHGITPAHACIQFGLSLPGVVAVQIDSSYSDRVAENIRSAFVEVPSNFWASMREEGLLDADVPGVR